MKKSELRQLIREELSKMINEEGSIKGHISDVVDKLNNLPFSGSATKRNNEIHYYLDDRNPDKEARAVKRLANSVG